MATAQPRHRRYFRSTPPRLSTHSPLDLNHADFSTIYWHEIDYSLYVLRQASRRSWRLGQRQPVEVHFSVYATTLQARALALVASKLRAALQVEGDITEDGLAGADGVEQDLVTELARGLAREATAEQSLESLFASLHTLEQRQGVALVDGAGDDGTRLEGWEAERPGSRDAPEPSWLPVSVPAIAALVETAGLAGWDAPALVPSTADGLIGLLPSGRRRPSQPRSRPAGPAVTQLDLFTTALPAPPDPRPASAAEDETVGAQLTLW